MVVRVLLVEDDEADAEFARRQFRQLGPEFALDRVACLKNVLVRLGTQGHYQLVLLDLGLPGINGIPALRSVAECLDGKPPSPRVIEYSRG